LKPPLVIEIAGTRIIWALRATGDLGATHPPSPLVIEIAGTRIVWAAEDRP
jgi:hypothetical protein